MDKSLISFQCVQVFVTDEQLEISTLGAMNTSLKCVCLISVTAAAFLMASCARSSSPTSTGTDMTVVPGVGVGPIKFGMTMDEVKNVVGEPDRTPGKPLQYLSLGLAVLGTSGSSSVGAIMMGDTAGGQLVEAFKGATKEGIRMKSTRQEMLAAYGQPESARDVGGGLEELSYDAGRTKYTLKNGRLVHITLRR